MTSTKGVTVVGAGGIGCSLGHALARAGWSVEMVDANPDKVAAGERHGLEIEGRPAVPAAFTHFQRWHPADERLILLCTKCFDTPTVLERLSDDHELIPIQNGFDDALRDRCGQEGIASYVSECDPDRPRTRITRAGDLHLGPNVPNAAPSDTMRRLAADLASHGAFDVKLVPDILPFKHSKLMYNAAISPLAAVTGLDNARLLRNADARSIFFRFLRENYRILSTAGIELGRIGPFHPDIVDRILRLPLIARSMAPAFARSLRNTYCSMSGDIERGRTEIDFFNGHLVRLADGTDCPLNKRACEVVGRMESEQATPSLDRLRDMAA